MQLRKIIKTRGHFPNDDAAIKLLYLALRNITKDWKMSAREWKSAMNSSCDSFRCSVHAAMILTTCFTPKISDTFLERRQLYCAGIALRDHLLLVCFNLGPFPI